MKKLFIILTFFLSISTFAQQSTDKIKATFIKDLTTKFTFPINTKSDEFVIGVLGKNNDGLINELKSTFSNIEINGQSVVVKRYKNILEIKKSQVLYVNGSDNFDASRVLRKVKGDKTLLVAENSADFDKSMVVFVVEKDKIKSGFNLSLIDAEEITYQTSLRVSGVLTYAEWQTVFSEHQKFIEANEKNILVSQNDLESLGGNHEEVNKKLVEQQLKNEKSLEEIEKLSFEAQAKELKIKAQNDEIRRNRLLAKNKEQENTLLRIEKERREAESQSQKTIITIVSIALVLILIFTFFVIRSWYFTKKQKEIIEVQKARVDQQKQIILSSKEIIEEKNKDITDSITYAKRIQQAKLPILESIKAALPDSFILFKPKDIVSGDFYYFKESKYAIFIAVCDCTGHGVPGAFMSLICMEKLEEAIDTSDEPAEILRLLNNSIKETLHQNEEHNATRDGMDMALCKLDKKKRNLTYAGANRPIWLVRDGQIEVDEIKATKKAIGGFTDDDQLYETHTLHLDKGDMFYIFSDGYADTFNGSTGKKLTTRKFREIILTLSTKPLNDQENYLDKFIEDWKLGTEQIDDICVMGVRV